VFCGGGVELAGELSEGGILAVDFRLPNPKPLNRLFKEFIREVKEREERGKEKKQINRGWVG
jgi:hypothetical protein